MTTTEAAPAVPGGVIAFIVVADRAVKELAALPANVTAVAPLRFEPLMVTVFPPDSGPDAAGVSPVIVGVGAAV